AEQQPVTRAQLQAEPVDCRVRTTQHAQQHSGVRVIPRSLPGQAPVCNLLLDPRVIRRELAQLVVPEQVETGVSDVADDRSLRPDEQRRHRRAEPAVIRLRERVLDERVVRLRKRLLDHPLRLRSVTGGADALAQGVDRDPARNVAGGMAPHPVRDREQPVLGRVDQCIFIAPSTQPEMAARTARQLHDCSSGSLGRHMDCHGTGPEMRIRSFIALVLVAAPACGRSPDEAIAQPATPPPAAALAPLSSDHGVEQALELLAREPDAALRNELDDGGASILRAEAITDRLLETRRPFAWIPDKRYFVDSRLRQIQAEADRILAQYQSGVPRDTVLAAVRALAADVDSLRQDLSRPGSPAPPSLRQLLAGDTTGQGRAAQAREPEGEESADQQ